jgi:starch synthase
MLAIVARLVSAKGLDLIEHIIDELIQNEDVQLVVLGTGDREYEDLFRTLAWHYPTKVSANITFNNDLAHRIYAASDIFLMPSQYEPCGIGQLIALHYGSIPVVRETGGLKDTVHSYNKYSRVGNGFTFANYNAHEVLFSIKRALGYYSDSSIWEKVVINAMNSDYSWTQSAKQYKELYYRLKK